ncbi:MAG: hypothetical protein Q9181_001488 [Wetmoreana brouardii]
MEGQHRGRSPSAGSQSQHGIRHSPSPHHYHGYNQNLNIDSSVSNPAFNPLSFSPSDNSPIGPDVQYSLPASFLDNSLQAPPYQQQHVLPSNDFGDLDRKPPYQQDNSSSNIHRGSSPSHLNLQQPTQHLNPQLLDTSVGNSFGNYEQQHSFGNKQERGLDNTFLLDPQLDMQAQHQSINPAHIMSNMSSPQNMIPTPPNLMPPEQHSSSHGSPQTNQGQFYSPNHSRQVSASLDPSAALNQSQSHGDWTTGFAGEQFQTHRRAPSEHSDFSSSVAPSPLLPQQDSFEAFDQPSPMLNPQQDNQMYNDALGIGQFSISDPQQQHPEQRISPHHSPYVSPRMSPRTGFGYPQDQFQLSQDMPNTFHGRPGPEVYPNPSDASFPQFQHRMSSADIGQADQMAPPEISVDLAPPSVPPNFEPMRPENDIDALSPPARGRRGRAKSETSISRPMTPNSQFAPPELDHRQRSLSPFDTHSQPSLSRETSPASKSRRSSTSSIPNRDYILELADPSRPSAAGGNDKRVQKHPATFQCTLCPKRFTRAYNLRSHLRTHTDERPFVCTVCGKAFARQHDRKRHEGLHSGEKKFVCKGELGTGGTWGCGRRFARADALGRHFRSEAGRICIKPLLDEEAMERQRLYDEQMAASNHQNGGLHPVPQPMMNGGFALPAALLAQYPALQGLQWDQLAGPGPGDEGEISGRSSFDASSGAESGYYEDDGVEGGYASGPGTGFGPGHGWAGDAGHEWASDYEGR